MKVPKKSESVYIPKKYRGGCACDKTCLLDTSQCCGNSLLGHTVWDHGVYHRNLLSFPYWKVWRAQLWFNTLFPDNNNLTCVCFSVFPQFMRHQRQNLPAWMRLTMAVFGFLFPREALFPRLRGEQRWRETSWLVLASALVSPSPSHGDKAPDF